MIRRYLALGAGILLTAQGWAAESVWAPLIDGQVLHANTVEFAPLTFRDVVVTPRLDGRILRFKECRASAYGGTITSREIATNLADGSYRCDFAAAGCDLAAGLREISGNIENLSGQVDGQIEFTIQADRPDLLTGQGRLVISKGSLVQLSLLTNLLVGDPGAAKGQDTLTIDFELRDQQIHIIQGRLDSPAAQILISGTIGFDGQLKILLVPRLAFKLVDQIPGLGTLFTPILSTVGTHAGRVLVRGQITKPILVADPFGRQE